MTTIAIDLSTGDLLVDGDSFAEVSGIEEIRQNVYLALNVHLGENVYDTDHGVPIIEEVAAMGTPPDRIAQIYREIILEVPGVTGFLDEPDLTLDEETRVMTLTFRATTDEGELLFSSPIAVDVGQEID
jgi:hypothetical protein